MRLPTRVRYAVRVVVELAGRGGAAPVPIKALAKAQGISAKYGKQLINRLEKAGIVEGFPGLNGGYLLALDPDKLSLLDIYRAMGESLQLAPCVGEPQACTRRRGCQVGVVWRRLSSTLEKELRSVTIGELAVRGRTLQGRPGASVRQRARAASRTEGVRP